MNIYKRNSTDVWGFGELLRLTYLENRSFDNGLESEKKCNLVEAELFASKPIP